MTAVLLAGQKWFLSAVHVAVLAYLMRLYIKKQVYMEAADAFRQLGKMKQWRFSVFVVYCLSFIFVTYWWVCGFEVCEHQKVKKAAEAGWCTVRC